MSRSESGWPMPPPAPRTATFVWRAAEEEKVRAWEVSVRAAERANMMDVGDGDGDDGGG